MNVTCIATWSGRSARLYKRRQVPHDEDDAEDGKGRPGAGDRSGDDRDSGRTQEWPQQPVRHGGQQERRSDEREEQVLHHVGADEKGPGEVGERPGERQEQRQHSEAEAEQGARCDRFAPCLERAQRPEPGGVRE